MTTFSRIDVDQGDVHVYRGKVWARDGLVGDVVGDVVGNVTGDVTGDVTGNVTGQLNGASLNKISQTVAYDDFTDGEGADGTIALTTKIPAGAFVLCCLCTACEGFAGDTSAVVTIGDGSDPDRYNTGTPSVFADAAGGVALGIPSGVQYHTEETTVTVTVTADSDYTSVSAGSLDLEIFYLT